MTGNHSSKRTWASISGYFEPDGPPTATVGDDGQGLLIRTAPFGRQGPNLCLTIDHWLEIKAAINTAIDEYYSARLAVVS